jgi:hypothetical protein
MLNQRYFLTFAAGCSLSVSSVALATPSTVFWTPATPFVQPFGVLHMTYDTYFRGGAAYPIDVGLEIGVLPWPELQLELGFDFFYPTFAAGEPVTAPLMLNAKLGAAEDVYFEGCPGWSFGIMGVGFKDNVTNYNMLHLAIGKTLPIVGSLSVGGYFGLNKELFVSSAGETQRAGFMASWVSPSIDVPVIDHLNLAWDVQTGNNAFGATGGGVAAYFIPSVALLTGPVFFFDEAIQPGGSSWMWTVQVDVDIDLTFSAEEPPPVAETQETEEETTLASE